MGSTDVSSNTSVEMCEQGTIDMKAVERAVGGLT
jgi:hypothetical protein